MNVPKVLQSEEGQWVVLGIIGLLVAVYVVKQAAKGAAAVADGAAGVVTGNNAATAGTEYEGTGILGTLGAVFDKASGGALSSLGDSIGGWLSPDYVPQATNRDQIVSQNYLSDLTEAADGDWQ